MTEKAGALYEVRVKSGGRMSRLFGGGEVATAETGTYDKKTLEWEQADRAEARSASLRHGAVQIVEIGTGRVVWESHPDKLPFGCSEEGFVNEIEEDLESLDVDAFDRRWGIEAAPAE